MMAEDSFDLEMTDELAQLMEAILVEENDSSQILHEKIKKWVNIRVIQTEQRKLAQPTSKKLDMLVDYVIDTRVSDIGRPESAEDTATVWRSYADFEVLHSYLETAYPWVVVPPLPEKKPSYTWQSSSIDQLSPGFTERRRAGLEVFLFRCASHQKLCQDTIFLEFLQKEYGWKENVFATEFQTWVHKRKLNGYEIAERLAGMATVYQGHILDEADILNALREAGRGESRLTAVGAHYKLKKLDRRFEDVNNYCTELQSNIGNILKIRARMCEKLSKTHKMYGNYARVFTEWSNFQPAIAEHLQSASQYMDIYSSTIDAQLEESEQFADHLKEYKAFCDSLRFVCRRYEICQYNVEKVENSLASKHAQWDTLEHTNERPGSLFSGMKTRLFGSETPEQIELKRKQLNEQILQTQTELKQAQKKCEQFLEAALKDIVRFQRQKEKELQRVFTNYAVLQVKQCKQAISVWTAARDSFKRM